MAGLGLLMVGILSLSAAGWIAADAPASPTEPPLEAGAPSSESRSALQDGQTDDEPSPPRSTDHLDAGIEPRDRSDGTNRVPDSTTPLPDGTTPVPDGTTPVPDEDNAAPDEVSADPVGTPARVEVPSLWISSELVDLGLREDGHLEVPVDPDLAGWWVGGPRPGEAGPAVIAGHVDSAHGPAVFYRLHELQPGDRITIHDDQGASTDFTVDRIGRWPKDDFPTDEVYRHADGAELRLITCGGSFDRQTRSYQDNVIVFATAHPTP